MVIFTGPIVDSGSFDGISYHCFSDLSGFTAIPIGAMRPMTASEQATTLPNAFIVGTLHNPDTTRDGVAEDILAEDTSDISLDIKRTHEMIDEYKKNLEEAQESLSQLKGIHAEDLYDQLNNVLQKFILKLKGKGIVVTEEAIIMFHLEFHDEEANLLKAEFIQVGSQIEIAEQNLIDPEKALADLKSQLQGIKAKQRSCRKELTTVNRQVASLKSKVEGLAQKRAPFSGEHLFRIDGAYDYINEELAMAWEPCHELRIQKTYAIFVDYGRHAVKVQGRCSTHGLLFSYGSYDRIGCRFVHDANMKITNNHGVVTKELTTDELHAKLLERLARDGAAEDISAEDTSDISLDIKMTHEMIDEFKKNLEEAHESLSQLKSIHAEVDVSLNRVTTTSAQLADAEQSMSHDLVALT
nr:hypothetical protein [Tanacetum cinerariifolium]